MMIKDWYPNPDLREIAAYLRALEARVATLEAELDVDQEPLAPTDIPTDDSFVAEVAEIADELRPDALQAVHKGFGRYEVRDDRGRVAPGPDDPWLTKDEAVAMVDAARQSR